MAQLSTHLCEQRTTKVTGRQSESTICGNKILMMAGFVAAVAKNGEKGGNSARKLVRTEFARVSCARSSSWAAMDSNEASWGPLAWTPRFYISCVRGISWSVVFTHTKPCELVCCGSIHICMNTTEMEIEEVGQHLCQECQVFASSPGFLDLNPSLTTLLVKQFKGQVASIPDLHLHMSISQSHVLDLEHPVCCQRISQAMLLMMDRRVSARCSGAYNFPYQRAGI